MTRPTAARHHQRCEQGQCREPRGWGRVGYRYDDAKRLNGPSHRYRRKAPGGTMIPDVFFVETTLKGAGFRCGAAPYDATVLLFEDESIMGFVASFETAEQLLEKWKEQQGQFIAKLAVPLRRAARKSWNCYAILLSRASAPPALRPELTSLEEDLTLTRKLVGDGISSDEDVERVLMPILPIRHQLANPQIDQESPSSRLTSWSGEARRLLETNEASPIDLIETLLGDQP